MKKAYESVHASMHADACNILNTFYELLMTVQKNYRQSVINLFILKKMFLYSCVIFKFLKFLTVRYVH